MLTLEYCEKHVDDPNVMVTIKLDDGHKARMAYSHAIIHGIIWDVYHQLGVPVTTSDIYDLSNFTDSTQAKIHTEMYHRLLRMNKWPHMVIVEKLFNNVHTLYNFTSDNMAQYAVTDSLYCSIKAMSHPKVDKLINTKIPDEHGYEIAEMKFEQMSNELVDLLNDSETCLDESTHRMMKTGVMNTNQIPQFYIGYSTRADIDDTMFRHIINNGALGGLKSAADYGVESTSLKKTTFYNFQVISTTQYFARELRLDNMGFINRYEGSCGSNDHASMYIEEGWGPNFVDKEVMLNGKKIAVTKSNCKEIEGQHISFASPTRCKHNDGVCEVCAGRATDHPWQFMPGDYLGSYAKSKMSAKAAQKVLSAKHLVKTYTKALELTDVSKKYIRVMKNESKIRFSDELKTAIKDSTLILYGKDMSPLGDLENEHVTPEGFGRFKVFRLKHNKTGEIVEIPVSNGDYSIHLSELFMKYMRENIDRIEFEDGDYYIPLSNWKYVRPFCFFNAINDDMVAFVKSVQNMIKTDIAGYTNSDAALRDLMTIVYRKVSVNVFWLEVIVRSLMDTPAGANGETTFTKIKEGIRDTSVSTKLAHENLPAYFAKPSTTVVPKEGSPLDPYFAFNYK